MMNRIISAHHKWGVSENVEVLSELSLWILSCFSQYLSISSVTYFLITAAGVVLWDLQYSLKSTASYLRIRQDTVFIFSLSHLRIVCFRLSVFIVSAPNEQCNINQKNCQLYRTNKCFAKYLGIIHLEKYCRQYYNIAVRKSQKTLKGADLI